MKEINTNQIIRFDGKNVFMEVMSSALEIGKVQINFIEYDASKAKNARQVKNIPLYVDIKKFLQLSQDILSGKIVALAKNAKDAQQKGGYKYCGEIWLDQGGISAKTLEFRGKSRVDKKALSRQLKITPGDKYPWMFSAEQGPGKESDTGLISMDGRPEEFVRVPLTDDDIKQLALIVTDRIIGYFASVETLEGFEDLESYKELIQMAKDNKAMLLELKKVTDENNSLLKEVLTLLKSK